jgi:hypothetical protein
MADMLGTTWWSILMLVCGAGAGMMIKPWFMRMMNRK